METASKQNLAKKNLERLNILIQLHNEKYYKQKKTNKEYLPKFMRSLIYSFLDFSLLVQKVASLSTTELSLCKDNPLLTQPLEYKLTISSRIFLSPDYKERMEPYFEHLLQICNCLTLSVNHLSLFHAKNAKAVVEMI